MSATTPSITAANPAARRRPVVSTGKNTTSIELLANNAGAFEADAAAAAAGGGADEIVTATGNGRALSHHSIRREVIVERSSKDLGQVKKVVGKSTVSPPRRTRKVSSKPEKPLWLTVMSVFAKNFVLLVVLVGLVQLIQRLALKSNDSVVGSLSEFEGRIAEVETLLKKTAKTIQGQVEVVDKKIEYEIGGLRKEVSNKIDEKGTIWESGLKKLEARREGLERSLSEMKGMDWLSKEEFAKIYDNLKVKGSQYESASLDEIRAYAKETIEKHAADGVGRVDYALASGGGVVVKHSEPHIMGKKSNLLLWSAKNGIYPHADNVLKPSFGEPGQCFPLKGSSGFFQVRLRTAIIPEAVTLEHIAKVMLHIEKN